jgi:4-diphosphocytidyl-2-C-methyl-D-erythritol kinase
MSREARVVAQAKLNLFLRILAREASGYHQIETLFSRIDLGDRVLVRTDVRGRSLDCSGERMPSEGLGPVERNLAWRAASAYADATGWPTGFAIELEKRIPTGGGLGGGSADAGAVLRCLDALSPVPVGQERLLSIAGTVGSDVPFLTATSPAALAWGRGERMLELAPLPPRPVLLAFFSAGVPTADAYRWLAESRAGQESRASELLGRASLGSWRGVARHAHNDFEAVVRPRVPLVDEVLAAFRSEDGAELLGSDGFALLAGSGSTVFAIPEVRRPGVSYEFGAEREGVEGVVTSTSDHVVEVDVSE